VQQTWRGALPRLPEQRVSATSATYGCICAVRWYLRYSLSLRDVEQLLAAIRVAFSKLHHFRLKGYSGATRG
jgi:hypothetical protein